MKTQNQMNPTSHSMNTPQLLATALITLALTPAFSQPQPAPQPPLGVVAPEPPKPPQLTKFSLDFPGGTPRQLVTTIQKAMGKTLNAIIPEEHAYVALPPLKMSN